MLKKKKLKTCLKLPVINSCLQTHFKMHFISVYIYFPVVFIVTGLQQKHDQQQQNEKILILLLHLTAEFMLNQCTNLLYKVHKLVFITPHLTRMEKTNTIPHRQLQTYKTHMHTQTHTYIHTYNKRNHASVSHIYKGQVIANVNVNGNVAVFLFVLFKYKHNQYSVQCITLTIQVCNSKQF